MQVHYGNTIGDGRLRVRKVSPELAVIDFGDLRVHVTSPADADAIIAAGAEAKRLLAPPACPRHPDAAYGECGTCNAEIDAAIARDRHPVPGTLPPERCGLPIWGDEARTCELPAGHEPAPACPGHPTGGPVEWVARCPSSSFGRQCERLSGHPMPHRAEGGIEWTGACPDGGCMLEEQHDGGHEYADAGACKYHGGDGAGTGCRMCSEEAANMRAGNAMAGGELPRRAPGASITDSGELPRIPRSFIPLDGPLPGREAWRAAAGGPA